MKPDTPRYQTLDDTTRTAIISLLRNARYAVLGTLGPDGAPLLTRIMLHWDGRFATALLSDLAMHSAALDHDSSCGLFVSDGTDSMAAPRLSLTATASRIVEDRKADSDRRRAWAAHDRKATLYFGLGDFRFWQFQPTGGLYNAGFGRAYPLTAFDISHAETPAT